MVSRSDFTVSCPGCRKSYQVPASLAGAEVTCETCGADFTVARPAGAPPKLVTGDLFSDLPPPVSPPPAAPANTVIEIPQPLPVEVPLPSTASSNPGDIPGSPALGPRRGGFLKSVLVVLTGACAVIGAAHLLKQKNALESHQLPERAVPVPASASASASDKLPEVAASPPPPMASTIPHATVPDKSPALPADEAPTQPDSAESPAGLVEKTGNLPAPVSPPVPETPKNPPPAPPQSLAKNDPLRLQQDSRNVLKQFLDATTVAQRLAVSQYPDKIRGGMEAWYQAHPSVPLSVLDITFLTEGEVPDRPEKFHLYNVQLKDQEAPIPVAVEQTPDGFRVDWPSFIESYAHHLKAFFAAPSEKPGRFRVLLRRAHYFGDPVPGQDSVRIAYSVEPPMRDETFTIWVDKDSPVFREKLATGERAGWEAQSYVIVELVWSGDDQRGRWVSLQRIVSDNWRAD